MRLWNFFETFWISISIIFYNFLSFPGRIGNLSRKFFAKMFVFPVNQQLENSGILTKSEIYIVNISLARTFTIFNKWYSILVTLE